MGSLGELNANQGIFNMHAFCNLTNIGIIRSTVKDSAKEPVQDQTLGILGLLRHREGYGFTDSRDRIYALLGLVTDCGFQADYNLDTEQTFTKFAIWVLSTSLELTILSYARGISSSMFKKIPSWAPSPDIGGIHITLLHVDHLKASGAPHCQGVVSKVNEVWSLGEGNHLRLRSGKIDSIIKNGDMRVNSATLKGKQMSLLQCAQVAGCTKNSDINLQNERYRRFCNAMTLQLSVDNQRASSQQTEQFHHYFQGMRKDPDPRGADPVTERLRTKEIISMLLTNWPRYHHFCLTSEDRFAWVPWNAEINDKIYIIRNARLPYVLRPQADGKFMLVGECWIQGLMEGEALDLGVVDWEDIYLIQLEKTVEFSGW